MATVVRNNFSEETHPWTKEIPLLLLVSLVIVGLRPTILNR